MPGVSIRIYTTVIGERLESAVGLLEAKPQGLTFEEYGGRPAPSSSGCKFTKAGRCRLLSHLRGITCNIVALDVHPTSADTRPSVGPEVKPYREG